MNSLLADVSRFSGNSAFSDTVICGLDGQREAHACLLAARSEVIERMLSSPLREGKRDVSGCYRMSLQFPVNVIDGLLRWIYSDSVASDLDFEVLLDLFVLADFLHVRGLVAACSLRMEKTVCTAKFSDALKVALLHDSPELKRCLAVLTVKRWDEPACAELVRATAPCVWELVKTERRNHLEKSLKRLSMVTLQAPAARAPFVFWRQRLPATEQHRLLQELLLRPDADETVVPYLWKGVQDAPDVLRSILDTTWKSLEDRRPFEALAEAEAMKVADTAASLAAQRASVQHELDLVCADLKGSQVCA